MTPLGLRVDVDTLSGTREGVPRLLDAFRSFGIRATFFLSAGPDNMGRHLRRVVRKDFLIKMLRSRAPGLYGWDVLLRGTLWPGPLIWKAFSDNLRRAAEEGHEVGLHAWDHHGWQVRAEKMSVEEVVIELERGMAVLSAHAGRAPRSFAAPGWRGTDALLRAEESLCLLYGSDCRGRSIFRPLVDGRPSTVPQVPVTLPTYDEAIGRDGITDDNYNDFILSRVERSRLNVLAVHAEVEGRSRGELFENFLRKALASGIALVPLVSLMPAERDSLPAAAMVRGFVAGREGWVAVQAPAC